MARTAVFNHSVFGKVGVGLALACILLTGLLAFGLSFPQSAEAKAASYEIIYKLDGGKFSGAYPKAYTQGKPVKLPTPKRTGHVFIGWYKGKDFARTDVVNKISAKAHGDVTLYARWKKKILLAHRGYHKYSPQNSIAATIAAKKKGFEWVEGDVRFTKDGVAILEHDSEIRMYVVSGGVQRIRTVSIKDMTYRQLQKAKLVGRPSGPNGANFSTFKQWMQVCKKRGVNPWIDMKSGSRSQIKSLYRIVRKYGLLERCMWTSHKFRLLEDISRIDPNAPLSWHGSTLSNKRLKRILKIEKQSHDIMVSLKYTGINARSVRLCKKHHLPLGVWGLRDETSISHYDPYLMKFDIDGLSRESAKSYRWTR